MKILKRVLACLLLVCSLVSSVPVYADDDDVTGAYSGGKKKCIIANAHHSHLRMHFSLELKLLSMSTN